MPIIKPKSSAGSVDLSALTNRLIATESDITALKKIDDVVRSSALPDFDLIWDIWIQTVEDLAAKTIEVCLFTRVSKTSAMPMVQRKLTIPTTNHANAIARADGTFENSLPRGVSLSYKTKLDLQNNALLSLAFPAGVLKSYQFEGLDASGTSLEISSVNIKATDTVLNLTLFYGNAAIVSTRWTFTYSDNQTVVYDIAVVR